MKASPMLSLKSSSYNSNTNLTEIAARVVKEFNAEDETDSDFFFNHETFSCAVQILNEKAEVLEKEENCDDDFEFAFVNTASEFSPISADEIFYNGQIRPIFNTDLCSDNVQFKNEKVSAPTATIRLPLRKLFIAERETTTSEADDLESIPPGTYCVWSPRAAEDSPTGQCKKSNSTGSSSKRWKLRDFLHRSNSDGKVAGIPVGEGFPAVRCPKNGGDTKWKSYLLYRQDSVGFFGNVNGLNRGLPPFRG
ncbi:PREDICTED: uncharacterized protein LOC109236239 isoform X2 [Nicotiana attenuata]|uniref:uncharacterized protein LOC109236239 isoform X2 n=1 Tax=Nicotiana attenuata TaxID=49451 RepID=UPI0009058E79|nr:PREDICTED: uncharacterized protein LOC109236239 isoform X2 [Nicotiana attenuata]